jgi:hypothetical protein
MMDENELTPEEKVAFQRLPREEDPSPFLEERVVESLLEEGILNPAGVSAPTQPSEKAPGFWIRPWMAAAAVVASLALFSSGIAMGQWMGSRSTAQVFLQVREQDAASLALRIQEAGSAYVSALAALGELGPPPALESPSSTVEGGLAQASLDMGQGREVALGAFFGAANELARMNPDDLDILRVVQILEERQAREEGRGTEDRNVVWF